MTKYLTYFTPTTQCVAGHWNHDAPTMLTDRPTVNRVCTQPHCLQRIRFERKSIVVDDKGDSLAKEMTCPDCGGGMARESRDEWQASYYRCIKYPCKTNGVIPFPKYWKKVEA